MLDNMCAKAYNSLREWEWKEYKKRKRLRLKNENFTVIASNCSGMFMYYDMGLRYLTPTVNLSIEMNDFVNMVRNLKWYMEQQMIDAQVENGCPVGILGDIRINFIHYSSFEEGARKWEERKRRINWDKLLIIGSEKDGCTYETIREFDKLPYENKVIFTHVEYPEFSSACYIKGFEDKEELGTIINYKRQRLKRRYLDDFDYVRFINNMR
mgnify:CR=1 FL=1